MKALDCSTLFIPMLCRELDYICTSAAQCITCIDDDGLVSGVVYDNYNGRSIAAHICILEGKVPSREWYAAIFDYPFNRLGVHKILGQVVGENTKARMLDEHFGFHLEGVIEDYSPNGDLLLYTMTKAQCRVLNSPRWSKINETIRRVA
jgi:hypothetical protein